MLYSIQSIELANIYLNLYCENSGIEKSEILKWKAIIAGARLSEDISDEESKKLFYIVNQYTGKI